MSNKKKKQSFRYGIIKLILAMIFIVLTAALAVVVSNYPVLSTYDFQLSSFCVILGGIICGGPLGFLIGILSPVVQYFALDGTFELTEMILTCIEFCIIGCVSGYMYKTFKKSYAATFLNVLLSILIGLTANFAVHYITTMVNHTNLNIQQFLQNNIYFGFFGFFIQLLLIPLIVLLLQKAELKIMK